MVLTKETLKVIEDLQQDMINREKHIYNTFNPLNKRIDDLRTDVDGHTFDMVEVKNRLHELESKFKTLEGGLAGKELTLNVTTTIVGEDGNVPDAPPETVFSENNYQCFKCGHIQIVRSLMTPEDALTYIVQHAKECDNGIFNMVHDGYMVVAVPYKSKTIIEVDDRPCMECGLPLCGIGESKCPSCRNKGPVKHVDVDLVAHRHCSHCGEAIDNLRLGSLCDKCQINYDNYKGGEKSD